FVQLRTGYINPAEPASSVAVYFKYESLSRSDVPRSCWAFSVEADLEGIAQIRIGQLISLSEQQHGDCSRFYGNKGCRSGYMESDFTHILGCRGIASEAENLNQATKGRCDTNNPKPQCHRWLHENSQEMLVLLEVFVALPQWLPTQL
ncbi:hypothetical protein DVH24_011429, partial [Malus domestica]